MAGLYVHIPFCKSRCIYCDFYSTASKSVNETYILRLIEELHYRQSFVKDKVTTLYFGGGTPSILTLVQLEKILTEIDKIFPLSGMEEVTFEANPDDLSVEYLRGLKELGINRLSVGIQSFDDNYLTILGRRHNSQQAQNAVLQAHNIGFRNITIDLMFALPQMTLAQWETTLAKSLLLPINHISAYLLSQEPNTALNTMVTKGLLTLPNEDNALTQFDFTDAFLRENGFIHYETSSYCLKDCYSKHNSNYWKRIPYLGIGASAHSFNGLERQWNVSNLKDYISKPLTDTLQTEILTSEQQYEEYIMLSLRTIEGINLSTIQNEFPQFYDTFLQKANAQMSQGLLQLIDNNLVASHQGQHLLNQLIVSLF
ncbi:MAG: radical SAM family heme chaperone HemW [Bacteroidales bacterium]|jgi:oxygen-independent coproporphyrinogen-3 oxidase|nr:radical SAM family heme chaperone HemW [Bacteroidales bacterium]